jgi:imidazolonepropionase-like amidohydrolase
MVRRADLILAGELIDGTGAGPREHQALVLEDGRIRAILPQADLTRTQRQDAVVLDLGPSCVLPGLIDTHVHLTFNAGANHEIVRRAVTEESDARLALRALANAQAHLAAGVTTVRDVGGRGFVTLAVRDAIREGLVPGPRMQASGPAITTTRGHLNYLGAIADNAEEVRRLAEEVLDAGADLVKVCATGGIMTAESHPLAPQYTVEELSAAVETAEERGTLVAAHALSAEGVERCVRAGIRSIEHCLWQEEAGVYRFRPEVAERMREKEIFAGLTFSGLSQARYWEHALGRLPKEEMGVWRSRMENRYAAERELIAAGVRYVLHSDAGVRETPFGAFWLVLAAGCFELRLAPLQAITAATATAAALLGLQDEVGTLEPGKRADLLVVEESPAGEIAALAKPRMVLLEGEIVAEHGRLSVPALQPPS